MKIIRSIKYKLSSTEEQDSFTGIIHWDDGSIKFLKNGKTHREDGPAVIFPDSCKKWYFEGKLHNLNGPARIYPDGREGYYIHGEPTTKEAVEFLRDLCQLKKC